MEPNFAFQKKLGIADFLYKQAVIDAIHRLTYCMKETNEKHGVTCEFFRLDFRQMNFEEDFFHEFPRDSFILDLKWGSKDELEEKQKETN